MELKVHMNGNYVLLLFATLFLLRIQVKFASACCFELTEKILETFFGFEMEHAPSKEFFSHSISILHRV